MSKKLSIVEFLREVQGCNERRTLVEHDAEQRKEIERTLRQVERREGEILEFCKDLDKATKRVKELEESWEEVVLNMPPGTTQRVVIDSHLQPHPLAFTQINAASDRIEALKEPTSG